LDDNCFRSKARKKDKATDDGKQGTRKSSSSSTEGREKEKKTSKDKTGKSKAGKATDKDKQGKQKEKEKSSNSEEGNKNKTDTKSEKSAAADTRGTNKDVKSLRDGSVLVTSAIDTPRLTVSGKVPRMRLSFNVGLETGVMEEVEEGRELGTRGKKNMEKAGTKQRKEDFAAADTNKKSRKAGRRNAAKQPPVPDTKAPNPTAAEKAANKPASKKRKGSDDVEKEESPKSKTRKGKDLGKLSGSRKKDVTDTQNPKESSRKMSLSSQDNDAKPVRGASDDVYAFSNLIQNSPAVSAKKSGGGRKTSARSAKGRKSSAGKKASSKPYDHYARVCPDKLPEDEVADFYDYIGIGPFPASGTKEAADSEKGLPKKTSKSGGEKSTAAGNSENKEEVNAKAPVSNEVETLHSQSVPRKGKQKRKKGQSANTDNDQPRIGSTADQTGNVADHSPSSAPSSEPTEADEAWPPQQTTQTSRRRGRLRKKSATASEVQVRQIGESAKEIQSDKVEQNMVEALHGAQQSEHLRSGSASKIKMDKQRKSVVSEINPQMSDASVISATENTSIINTNSSRLMSSRRKLLTTYRTSEMFVDVPIASSTLRSDVHEVYNFSPTNARKRSSRSLGNTTAALSTAVSTKKKSRPSTLHIIHAASDHEEEEGAEHVDTGSSDAKNVQPGQSSDFKAPANLTGAKSGRRKISTSEPVRCDENPDSAETAWGSEDADQIPPEAETSTSTHLPSTSAGLSSESAVSSKKTKNRRYNNAQLPSKQATPDAVANGQKTRKNINSKKKAAKGKKKGQKETKHVSSTEPHLLTGPAEQQEGVEDDDDEEGDEMPATGMFPLFSLICKGADNHSPNARKFRIGE
jgi:hypothetical protein